MSGNLKIRTGFCLFLLLMFLSGISFGQEEDIFGIERQFSRKSESNLGNVFRNAISRFSLEVTGGIGYHQNQLSFLSEVPQLYPIRNHLDPQAPIEIGSGSPHTFENNAFFAYPFNAGVRVDIFGIFTLGGGYGKEFGKVGEFKDGDYQFDIDGSSYSFDKFYGTFGLILYDARRRASFLRWRYGRYSSNNYYMQSELKQRIRQNYPWHFVLEGEYGSMKPSKPFDSHLTVSEPYYALGLRIERELSEYAKLFIKPAASFVSMAYERTVPVNNLDTREIHGLKQTLYSVNIGLSISIPGAKRCKVPGCGVVMKHLHDGVEYRGSSIWKLQNRKVGQWYK